MPDAAEYVHGRSRRRLLRTQSESRHSAFVRAHRRRSRGLCQSGLLRRIWKDLLYRQRRWMSGPAATCASQSDPVADLGMEYHTRDRRLDARECSVFTYRSRSRRSRKSRFRWYSRCTAIPAQAKSTRAIPSGTRLRISMALTRVHPSATPGQMLMSNRRGPG